MPYDYSPKVARALAMISKYGDTFTFVKSTVVLENPDMNWDILEAGEGVTMSPAVSFADGTKRTIYVAGSGLPELDDDDLVRDPSGVMWGFKKGTLQALDPGLNGQIILWEAEISTWPT